MPLNIVRNDITRMQVDAIVNAANRDLLRGGGVCGAIFSAAGPQELQAACDRIGHCDTGSAVATEAFRLPARHVIHAVGPVWRGGTHHEEEDLRGCYRTALEIAHSLGDTSIAFPLISAGIYGYPKDKAIDVALSEIQAFLDVHEMDVYLTIFDAASLRVGKARFSAIEEYIDDTYVDNSPFLRSRRRLQDGGPRGDENATVLFEELGEPLPAGGSDAPAYASASPKPPTESAKQGSFAVDAGPVAGGEAHAKTAKRVSGRGFRESLASLLKRTDKPFSGTLLEMIDQRGLKDSDVYKKANLSRQHFSKIRSNPTYRPKKQTVLALAVALGLDLTDTRLLLERAGFSLTHADKRDIIVEYFIRQGMYDINEINLALYSFDQPLLG